MELHTIGIDLGKTVFHKRFDTTLPGHHISMATDCGPNSSAVVQVQFSLRRTGRFFVSAIKPAFRIVSAARRYKPARCE